MWFPRADTGSLAYRAPLCTDVVCQAALGEMHLYVSKDMVAQHVESAVQVISSGGDLVKVVLILNTSTGNLD